MKSIIATTAILATVSATHWQGKHPGAEGAGKAFLVNRCSYPVHLWSIDKQTGCDESELFTLQPGDDYTEDMRNGTGSDDNGISIKLSKTNSCTKGSLTQWEYKLSYVPKYEGNFLDVSFVDCYGDLEACPGRTDGYYMRAGDQVGGITKSAVNNQHCPVFSVANAEEAARVAYVNWNDEQTKWCPTNQDMQLYLCGGEAPGDEDESAAPSSKIESSSAKPSSSSSSFSKEAASSTSEEANFVVAAAAAITEAPVPAPIAPVIKTEVVYVTEYVKARHAHGRRHQQFHG